MMYCHNNFFLEKSKAELFSSMPSYTLIFTSCIICIFVIGCHWKVWLIIFTKKKMPYHVIDWILLNFRDLLRNCLRSLFIWKYVRNPWTLEVKRRFFLGKKWMCRINKKWIWMSRWRTFYLPLALTAKMNVYLCICTVPFINNYKDYYNI